MRTRPFDWDVHVEVMPDRKEKRRQETEGHVWSTRYMEAAGTSSKDEFASDWVPACVWQLRNAAEAIMSMHASVRVVERDLETELTRIRHSHANRNRMDVVWVCQKGFGMPLARSSCRERGAGQALSRVVHIATSRMTLVMNASCTRVVTMWLHKVPFDVWYSRTKHARRC